MAADLADALGWEVVSSDRVRKITAGVDPFVRGTETERRELYSAWRTRRTYETMSTNALDALERGQGVVLDATFSAREDREAVRKMLIESSFGYCFVEMTASDDTIRERLRERENDERSLSDARPEDFDKLNSRYEAPDDLEDALHIQVTTEDAPDVTMSNVLTLLIRMELGRSMRPELGLQRHAGE
jgi:hypothetical protein